MRRLIVLLIFITSFANADPGDRRSKEERQKARIERQFARKSARFDERTEERKKKDRQAVVALVIVAGLIVASMGRRE